KNNPSGFNNWTVLITIIEKSNDIEKIRKVYSEFLNEFPLCFLYWKRYADHEYAHNNAPKAIQVFEEAVKAVSHSVDIWLNYVTHLIDKSHPVDQIREVFKRGSKIIGTDFQSSKFWEKYIEFELTQNENQLSQVFNSILKTPLENIQFFYDRFKELIDRINVKEMITQEEHNNYTGDETETKNLILKNREIWFNQTLEKTNSRLQFELIVNKRFFFHIQPIDDMTLSVWRSYFSFMEKDTNSTKEEIIKLYERCLIPCCYYSEFWLKYVEYLEKLNNQEETKINNELIENIFERATKIFLKKRPDIHLKYSLYLEGVKGDTEKAKSVLDNIHSLVPNHIETILRIISFKKRNQLNSTQEIIQYFKSILQENESDKSTYPFLLVNYIKFLLLNSDSNKSSVLEESREKLNKAVTAFSNSKLLWSYFINFETNIQLFSNDSDKESNNRIIQLYERALNTKTSSLSSDDKIEFFNNYLEFTINQLEDIQLYRDLEFRFLKLYPDGKPESKKRSLNDLNNNSNNNINNNNNNNANGTTSSSSSSTNEPQSKRIAYSVPPTSNGSATISPSATNPNAPYYYQQQPPQQPPQQPYPNYQNNYYAGGYGY
ncbi:hypothetical protein DICPUDRAFT_25624, partial [Dictyostelium purpureum]